MCAEAVEMICNQLAQP